ncbi:UNVERIFIED_CONTAM: hypothetical protein RMT77_017940 [Armadillidium vulgare]
MRGIIVLLSVLVCASAIPAVDLDWEEFKIKYNKQYSPEEDIRRVKIFTENKIKIAEHNKKFDEGLVTFTMGINKFADMLPEETSYLRGYKRTSNSLMKEGSFFQAAEGVTYNETVDWRDEGYVTPVKDQGQCGSCWAFSATGSLEGQNFKKTGTLVSLSEQNLVDCVPNCYGCDGGLMVDAFHYVRINGGIDTEDSYPYFAMDGDCSYSSSTIGGTCNGFRMTKPKDENSLLAATATIGPISTAIDAGHYSFQMYSGGVYYEEHCSETKLDHGVLIVGYGTQNGKDYWLVKNSWGTDWGIDGYIKMSRNRRNNCGIATDPSYPLV